MGVGRRGSSRSAPCAHALRPRHGDQECRKRCTCGAQGRSRSKTRPGSSIYISTRPYPARGLPAAPVLSYGTRSWALLNLHVPYTRATSHLVRPCVCDEVTKSWLRRRDEGAAAARGHRTKQRDGWRRAEELEPSPTADDLMQHLICAQRRELRPSTVRGG